MDEKLKQRFLKRKIEDFVADNLKPFPTIICEREDPESWNWSENIVYSHIQ